MMTNFNPLNTQKIYWRLITYICDYSFMSKDVQISLYFTYYYFLILPDVVKLISNQHLSFYGAWGFPPPDPLLAMTLARCYTAVSTHVHS